ncbi:homoserine dehydrogenase [Kytococcus sedentarius]|uniref:homoserine dehydrogenase n=1 Tax=Kytococcus sedentarius TaxID=1276 RepID=UPI0035BBC3A6
MTTAGSVGARPVGVALIGYGTVGQGVAAGLAAHHDRWLTQLGVDVQLRHVVVRDAAAPRDVPAPPGTLGTDAAAAVADPAVDLVVEVAGMVDEGRRLLGDALRAGKHVVSANKALLSAHGEELAGLAQEHGVNLLFEAAVAGGVPIVRGLRDLVRVDHVHTVDGILNGSCNYILTAMSEGTDYETVAARAQELGYLEADPTADVSGADSLRKLRLLASMAFGGPVLEEDIDCTGIDRITAADILALKAAPGGPREVRLLGRAQLVEPGGEAYTAVVEPVAVPQDHWAAGILGSTNAVTLGADQVGALTFSGPGAGRHETASAVLTDLVDVLLGAVPTSSPLGDRRLRNTRDEVTGRWYVRSSDALSTQLEPLLERTHLTSPLSGLTGVVRRSELQPWLDDPGSCVIRWEPAAHDLDAQEDDR